MDAALLRRFRGDLARLVGAAPRIGIAISGGPDSLALLLLAHEAFGGTIAAATVDHQLRPESADEARYTGEICAKLGVSHAILTPSEPITGNLQAGAREARYALLGGWRLRENLGWIATAHHADDQLETMVMRLLRGSGVDGLSGIRPVNGRIVRPLLGFRRAELSAIVDASGFEPVDDPSNRDPRFDRVRLRRALADLPDIEPRQTVRSATALREASEALAWSARREAARVVIERDDHVLLTETGFPPELLRRLVVTCLDRIEPGCSPRGPALDKLIASLARGEKATLGGILGESADDRWRFGPAPARRTG